MKWVPRATSYWPKKDVRLGSRLIYIGIDPGLDGAIAYIQYCVGHARPYVAVVDTPTVSVRKTDGRKKREYDIAAMGLQLRQLVATTALVDVFAAIEKVHAMPGQGVSSMFSMGYGCGLWEGLLGSIGIAYQRVAPQTWQKKMLADEGKGKDAHRLQAQRLYPNVADLFARKKDDGRADALLMAEYGRRWRA